ncbi:polymorphic toxin-type HINT domain-containing protein, partial [Paenibacillus tarimensis]
GEKNIEDIEVGDMVLSRDESGESEEVEYKEVVQLFRKVSDSIYTIYVGDQAIEATGNHPFWVEGKGWLLAEELSEGDQLVQSNGNHLQVERITFEPRQEVVYNFEVARFHTYFVSDIGVWVHNENQEYCQRKEKGKDKTRQYFPTERAAKRAAYRDAGIGKHGKRKPVHEQLNPGSRHPHKSSNQTRDAWLSEKGHKVAHDRYGHKDPFDTPHFNVYFKDGRNYHYYYPSSYNPSRNK